MITRCPVAVYQASILSRRNRGHLFGMRYRLWQLSHRHRASTFSQGSSQIPHHVSHSGGETRKHPDRARSANLLQESTKFDIVCGGESNQAMVFHLRSRLDTGLLDVSPGLGCVTERTRQVASISRENHNPLPSLSDRCVISTDHSQSLSSRSRYTVAYRHAGQVRRWHYGRMPG
jgi:hypothetical protein